MHRAVPRGVSNSVERRPPVGGIPIVGAAMLALVRRLSLRCGDTENQRDHGACANYDSRLFCPVCLLPRHSSSALVLIILQYTVDKTKHCMQQNRFYVYRCVIGGRESYNNIRAVRTAPYFLFLKTYLILSFCFVHFCRLSEAAFPSERTADARTSWRWWRRLDPCTRREPSRETPWP